MNHFRPRKQKFNPKKSSIEVKWERMQDFLDTVEARSTINDIDLQFVLGLGDGQYYAIKTAVKARHHDLVEWQKKSKTWKWIAVNPEKPTMEEVSTKHLEVKTLE